MKAKILDELHCFCCNKKLSQKQPLFETAWSGVYWCGESACALHIMEAECEELNVDDKSNHEWDCICPACK